MKDLDLAKKNLDDHTLALCKGENVIVSDKRGVAPMIDFIDAQTHLTGYCAADTIVGKAVASMFVKAGIAAVYGQVMSKSAHLYLQTHGIYAEYATLVDVIINRQGTGQCPMEEAVKSVDDPDDCFLAIKEKIAALKANRS